VKRRRLDLELVVRGRAATEEQAQDLIGGWRVVVAGSLAVPPSTLIASGGGTAVEPAP
jgi:predicted rRNA methylase YqxC with S4 and FtsJ domains